MSNNTEVEALITQFCLPTLGSEFHGMAIKLCRKLDERRSGLLRTGKPELWASAIVHTVGILNFLFDPTFEPMIKAEDISQYYEVNHTLMLSKSKFIREKEDLGLQSEEFLVENTKLNNPLKKYTVIGGIIVRKDDIPESHRSILDKTN